MARSHSGGACVAGTARTRLPGVFWIVGAGHARDCDPAARLGA